MSKYFKELQVRARLTGSGLLGKILKGNNVFIDGVSIANPKKLTYEDLCAARKIVVDGKIMKDRDEVPT